MKKKRLAMKKGVFLYLVIALSFSLMITVPLWAAVPHPPVNQIMGVNDGVFNNIIEDDCRCSHEDSEQLPVKDETLPSTAGQ
jgi:hypothetical protein